LLLSNTFKLKSYDAKIFVVPDEPLEVRRKCQLHRLKAKAEHEGKSVSFFMKVCLLMGLSCLPLKTDSLNEMDDVLPLTVISYNSCGFAADKQAYMRMLLSKCSILCVQEHWLSDSQLPLLGHLNQNFSYAGVSGFGNNDVLFGRPCGRAVLWRNDIDARVQVLQVCSKRISAVRLRSSSFSLLLISVYMPCDGNDSRIDDYTQQLAIMDSLIEAHAD